VIFVDTSFWVALRNRRDARHLQAVELLEKHKARVLVTTNLVQGETWTFLRRKAGHGAAVSFLDTIEQSPRVRLVRVEAEQETRAWKWLRQHDERVYSFVDATSFVLMQQLRTHDAFSFDDDFTAAGFVELRP
jgi:predicted nucleic acid-binding protein